MFTNGKVKTSICIHICMQAGSTLCLFLGAIITVKWEPFSKSAKEVILFFVCFYLFSLTFCYQFLEKLHPYPYVLKKVFVCLSVCLYVCMCICMFILFATDKSKITKINLFGVCNNGDTQNS